jgi:hypothetical protein
MMILPAKGGTLGDPGLDAMFGNLELWEDEFDDFVLEEEDVVDLANSIH